MSPNGSIGTGDLTVPGAGVFGANVFGPVAQRQRLPKDVFRRLQGTIGRGEPLDPAIADEVAAAMKEWALEKGATHFTHWFQPLTGLTAEKHDSFLGPTGDGAALAAVQRAGADPGRARRVELPVAAACGRRSRRAATRRGTPPARPSSCEGPNGTTSASRRPSVAGPARRWTRRRRCCARWRPSRAGAADPASSSATTGDARVFTTLGPEQEYFLIDENFFYARPDLLICGRTLFGAKPPKGQELEDHYFGSIPERVLAFMAEAERSCTSSACRSRPGTTRWRPASTRSPRSSRSANVATDHQQLIMEMMQTVARRYGLACLLHEKPFAGINGSGKHNNWSMATDTGENLLEPGDDAARQPAVPRLLRRR